MELFQTYVEIVRDLGFNLDRNSVIVDLGCGDGNLVNEYRRNDYQAFGCDFEFKPGLHVNSMKEAGIIKLISKNPYRLPFEDNSVDFLLSNQVFEHVSNYQTLLSEIKRVLKVDGVSLHVFPSRYTPIEPHLFVPLGTIIRENWWLKIWSGLGIRNQYQTGLSADETVILNRDYLMNRTNYLSKKDIRNHCRKYFHDVRFCENLFLKYGKKGRIIYHFSKAFPFLPAVYSSFRSRVLFLKG